MATFGRTKWLGLIAFVALSTAAYAPSAAPMVLVVPVAEFPEAVVAFPHETPRLSSRQESIGGVLVKFRGENTRENLEIRIPTDASKISAATMREMRSFLRCHRTGRKHRINAELVALLARVADAFPGRTIEIVSGFRARPYGVPQSRHFRGRAVDFRVVGVPVRKVRDFVWGQFDDVGVGHYHHQQFVHLDVRPESGKIGWDQRRAGRNYQYNPRWARVTPPAINVVASAGGAHPPGSRAAQSR